jgi:hypothetical protein
MPKIMDESDNTKLQQILSNKFQEISFSMSPEYDAYEACIPIVEEKDFFINDYCSEYLKRYNDMLPTNTDDECFAFMIVTCRDDMTIDSYIFFTGKLKFTRNKNYYHGIIPEYFIVDGYDKKYYYHDTELHFECYGSDGRDVNPSHKDYDAIKAILAEYKQGV